MEQQNYSDDAEKAVLSACMWSPLARQRAREILSREDFWDTKHEEIWVALEEMDAAKTPIDPVTLPGKLTGRQHLLRLLPDLLSSPAVADNVEAYATDVRSWAVRRRAVDLASTIIQRARDLTTDPYTLTSTAITRFTELRDTGTTSDLQSRLLADLLAEPDDKVDWAVKGLLEKRDRFVITGGEGGSKSFISRQVGIFAAAGLHPFTQERMRPARVQILDYENSWSQMRRGSRMLYDYARSIGEDPADRIHVASLPRIDITRDRDLGRIHRELDVAKPDVVVVGPLYRLTSGAIQTDDDAAPVLAALDTLRDRGCALVIEAHAGHGRDAGGDRDLRPRGSSALLGWPEFGYGMKRVRVKGNERIRMVPWRGDRSERAWPMMLMRAQGQSTHFVPDYDAEIM